MIIATSERLVLRHFHIVDTGAMAPIFADPEVMRFGPGPRSLDWTSAWIAGCLQDYHQKWGFGLWAVVQRQLGVVIGFCGLSRFDDVAGRAEVEVGYRIASAHWGQGLATEAAMTVQGYAFATLNMTRLVSLIANDNQRSIRVASKCGMQRWSTIEFQGKSVELYGIERLK